MVTENMDECTIGSVETTLDVIDALRERNGAGVSELASLLDVSKSTIHRHLTTLYNRGYVTRSGDTYMVGLEFLNQGIHSRNKYKIYDIAYTKVVELAEETGERTWCIVEENGIGYYLCGASGKHPVHPPVRTGQWSHLHQTSGGKAILAQQSPERIDEIVERYGLPAKTEHTITDPDVLSRELETVRESGIAFNKQESLPGLHAVGAPILDQKTGMVLGAISISGPANRLKPSVMEGELAELILGTTNEIEINITYR